MWQPGLKPAKSTSPGMYSGGVPGRQQRQNVLGKDALYEPPRTDPYDSRALPRVARRSAHAPHLFAAHQPPAAGTVLRGTGEWLEGRGRARGLVRATRGAIR